MTRNFVDHAYHSRQSLIRADSDHTRIHAVIAIAAWVVLLAITVVPWWPR